MQEPQTLYSSFFLRRKYKLLRALANPTHLAECTNSRQHLLALYDTCVNKDNQISQIDYFLKHEFNCNPVDYSQFFMEIVWEVMAKRQANICSFIVYRLCRKYPDLFWQLFSASNAKMPRQNWSMQQLIYFTDLFLYGFPFTLEDFLTKIFPHFKHYLIDLIPRYLSQLQSNLVFPAKYQKIIMGHCLQWLEEEKDKIVCQYQELKRVSFQIQNRIVAQASDQEEMNKYQIKLQKYETLLHRFDRVASFMEIDFEASYKLKTIFQLKKECQTFKTTFALSTYEQSLYTSSNQLKDIKPLKKNDMLKLQQSEAFINQIKLCRNINQCLNLGGYFLQQMNLQKNREYLIETIINQCYQYNNISYILKIVFQVSQRQPNIRQYCETKARKICSTNRMNPKYQKLLCEMARFSLIDQQILLQYCQRLLKNQNQTSIREVESILQQLGTIVYYRSLQANIRINSLFERMQNIVKGRLVQFSTQNLYHLKGLLNYLRNHTNSIQQTETRFMSEFQIKENFDFILTKMQKLLKQQDNKQVLQYLVDGVDNQEYLTSYYYASLLRELSSQQLEQNMHRITVKNVQDKVKSSNYQKAVIWSRFLGELYNYECISRHAFLKDLSQILKIADEEAMAACSLKCVCSALETSKTYLKPNSQKKQRQMLLFLLSCKIVYLKHRDELQFTLNCEFQDIISFFNPQLLVVLNFVEEVDQFVAMVQSTDRYNANLSYYISRLAEGDALQEIKTVETGECEVKKKYKEKESTERTERKWVEKQTGKRPQLESSETAVVVSEFRFVAETESMSKQSVNTIESATNRPVKKMNFIGRRKRDNQITTISCSIVEQL